jgi:transglutaminase-like putative cysteine protease
MKTAPETIRRENALAERAAGYWLLAAAIVVLLPLVPRLPWWLAAVLAALFGWRFLILRRAWRAPNRWLRYALTLLLAALLYRQYGTLFGRDPGSAMLAAMLALKFLELQRLRDYVLSVLVVYFLIFIGFLNAQAPWLVLYLLAVLVLSSATLVRLAVPGARARFALRLSVVLLLQALPLMLAMHLFFPRIQGSLWGMPQDAQAGAVGLTDELRPGSINELIFSEDIAFRAYFSGPVPAPAERYWRALVLWDTDGRLWKRGLPSTTTLSYDAHDTALAYTLTIEPSSKPWLPALGLPAQLPDGALLRSGLVLESRQPIRERLRVPMSAHLRYRLLAMTDTEQHMGLQLPSALSPRVAALAKGWRARSRNDAELVRTALEYFREQKFFYTLAPPLLGDDPVDEFLFESRRGFCEHYATAFVTLMRAAGIPARIVAGYQGGELNPAGNYLIVYQSDAHAWAEAWLPGQGWMRVDPTAAIAPERIEYGADGLRRLLARGAALGGLPAATLRNMLAQSWLETTRQRLRLALDTANTVWQRWVLDYDLARQRELLERLGIGDATTARLLGVLALLVAVLFGAYIVASMPRRVRPDPVQKAYLEYCRKLARAGMERAPQEGALAFAARVSLLRPDVADSVRDITGLYLVLRYGVSVKDSAQRRLVRLVQEFRVARG